MSTRSTPDDIIDKFNQTERDIHNTEIKLGRLSGGGKLKSKSKRKYRKSKRKYRKRKYRKSKKKNSKKKKSKKLSSNF
jgi:hypothetical protein